MKYIFSLVLAGFLYTSYAQSDLPRGFTQGKLVCADGTLLHGFVKDYIGSRSSVVFMRDAQSKKKEFHGHDLVSAELGEARYLCLHGDFFRIISEGELLLLQKSSDASATPIYNGNEAVFVNGTDGKKNDYFIYETKTKELKLVNKKNIKEVSAAVFNGYTPAIDASAGTGADLAVLKKAVELYNTRPAK